MIHLFPFLGILALGILGILGKSRSESSSASNPLTSPGEFCELCVGKLIDFKQLFVIFCLKEWANVLGTWCLNTYSQTIEHN